MNLLSRTNNFFYRYTGIYIGNVSVMKKKWREFPFRKDENLFVLRTMPKSGSHYYMNLLANYIGLTFFDEKESLDFLKIKKQFWGTQWNVNPMYSPETLFEKTGYGGFVFIHIHLDLRDPNCQYYKKKPKKIINTYRNPLDTIVSQFYYSYEGKDGYDSPRDCIHEIKIFIDNWKGIKELSKQKNVKNIAYEDLILNTAETLKEIIDFSGMHYDEGCLLKAIDASKRENVQKYEKTHRGGKNLYEPEKASQSHARSGKIGQWKEHFTDDDIKEIERELEKEGILLSEFILE